MTVHTECETYSRVRKYRRSSSPLVSRRSARVWAVHHWQVRVAEPKVCPVTVLLLMVAFIEAGRTVVQVASPCCVMLVFFVSDVDQVPCVAGIEGQFPVTDDFNENCA